MHQRVGLPLAAWDCLDQPLTPGCPTAKSGEIRLQARFIEKDQSLGINFFLSYTPILSL